MLKHGALLVASGVIEVTPWGRNWVKHVINILRTPSTITLRVNNLNTPDTLALIIWEFKIWSPGRRTTLARTLVYIPILPGIPFSFIMKILISGYRSIILMHWLEILSKWSLHPTIQ